MSRKVIPYGRQIITQADIAAVVEVLESDFLTQGPMVPKFEHAVTRYCGSNYGIATNSATSALHIACLALGLSKGDWLWTSPITFVASANCGLYCGANIDFVDICPDTFNMCVSDLEYRLKQAEKRGRLPKILVVVHFAGQPADMKRIKELSEQYGFRIIEDASHAIGSEYRGSKTGCCEYSDITVFSFHPVKIITSAEGGMALTNSKSLSNAMESYRSHGIAKDHDKIESPVDGPWFYEQQVLGFNYRMTDVLAALGCSQLQRVDEFIDARRALKARYDSLLSGLPLSCPQEAEDRRSSWHLYVVRVQGSDAESLRLTLFNHLRAHGIGVNVHYIPVHTQPVYQKMGFSKGDFPLSERYYESCLTLPLHAGLSHQDQDTVVARIKEICT